MLRSPRSPRNYCGSYVEPEGRDSRGRSLLLCICPVYTSPHPSLYLQGVFVLNFKSYCKQQVGVPGALISLGFSLVLSNRSRKNGPSLSTRESDAPVTPRFIPRGVTLPSRVDSYEETPDRRTTGGERGPHESRPNLGHKSCTDE